MITWLSSFLILAAASRFSLIWGMLFLTVTIQAFFQIILPDLNWLVSLSLAIGFLFFPLSFMIAGSYLDSFLANQTRVKLPLAFLGLLIGVIVCLEAGFLEKLLGRLMLIVTTDQGSEIFASLLALFNIFILNVTSVVLLFLLLALCFSLPIAWLANNSRLRLSWNIPHLNIILVLFFLSVGYEVLVSVMEF